MLRISGSRKIPANFQSEFIRASVRVKLFLAVSPECPVFGAKLLRLFFVRVREHIEHEGNVFDFIGNHMRYRPVSLDASVNP